MQVLAERFKQDFEANGKTSANISMISADDKVPGCPMLLITILLYGVYHQYKYIT